MNSASQQGALQRAGVKRLVSDKKGKRRKMLASKRIREAIGFDRPFTEEGQTEKTKNGKKNRVYLVTVIEEGLGNSKDKNFYSAQALKSGVKVFESAKAYADHPDAITEKTLPERSMKDLVGWYSDCFTDTNPKTGKVRLRAKLHFFPSAKWLTDMIDTILTDSSAKNLFGISINAVGKTREATMGGEQVNFVEEFQRVDSADVVTEPAARGKFDKMLESRRKLHNKKRTRESVSLSPEKLKEVADSLVSGYNSDNVDELRQAAADASKVLHAAASISGKGSGQPNEEQYSNINPSGGRESMANSNKKRVKASTRKPLFRKGKRRMQQEADGTGPDNEEIDEPEPSDYEGEDFAESDVEDEEDRGDLGDQGEHGSSKYHKVKASSKRSTREDEGLEGMEDEDEGMEDEGMEDEGMEDEGMEDEHDMMPGASMAQPAGGGAPGSSRTIAAEADDDDMDDDGDDDMDDMDESDEDDVHSSGLSRPNVVAESRTRRGVARRRRRTHEADGSSQGGSIKKASYAGGLGHSGHSSLPKGGDPTRGYEDSDEDFGKEDSSTSGVGKSYKLKTSRFSRNKAEKRFAKPIVREANRRIEILEDRITRLRESVRELSTDRDLYAGKVRFIESGRRAKKLLREAVKRDFLSENAAEALYPILEGMSQKRQVREIWKQARFLESAKEGVLSELRESVDGNGARGGFASFGTAEQNSDLMHDGFVASGIPMKKD